MKITPRTHLLESIRSQNLSYRDVLGELIDNAIDAHAKNITIDLSPKRVVITDDGVGCSDMEAMFTLGEHKPHPHGKGLGIYGIGLKDAEMFFWGKTQIESIKNGRKYAADADWPNLTHASEWVIDDPVITPAEGKIGTIITFYPQDRHIPQAKALEQLRKELAFLFTPAIKRQIRITMRRSGQDPVILDPYDRPNREQEIGGTLTVEGRTLNINVGIVPAGQDNPKPGLQYVYKHRVVLPTSPLGCGDYGIGRIFGWVVLSDDWRLTKNKNDLAELKDELAAAVYDFCRPVLEQANQQMRSLQLSGLETRVTELMRDILRGGQEPESRPTQKERRERGTSHGTVTPKHTGRPRGAKKVQPGDHIKALFNPAGLRVEISELDASFGIGLFSPEGNRVILSQDHPAVRFYVGKADPLLSDLGIVGIVTGLLANHLVVVKATNFEMFSDVPDHQKFAQMADGWLREAMTRLGGGAG